MARKLFDTGIFSIIAASGGFGVGWSVGFFTANTSTEITTYNAPSAGSANTNPVVADAEGRLGQIWYEDGQDIKWVMYDAAGAVKVTVNDYPIPDAPPSFSALLDLFLSAPAANPLPVAYGGTASTSAVNALTALGALGLVGGTITGAVIRSGAGAHLYNSAAGQTTGGVFVVASASADPTTTAGQWWARY